MDILEKLEERAVSYEQSGPSAHHTAALLREAAAEIKSLRSQWWDMACRILTQAQQTNAMVRDANSRIDRIEARK